MQKGENEKKIYIIFKAKGFFEKIRRWTKRL
jgi:hypothetical protein